MAATEQPTFRDIVLGVDPWLVDVVPAIEDRHNYFNSVKKSIQDNEGGYDAFSRGYEKFGLNVKDDGTLTYHEWAPNAVEASLIGDFSMLCFALDSDPH